MGRPSLGSTLDGSVDYYFPGLPLEPKKHARGYLARLIALYQWRIGACLDELPAKAHRLGEGAKLLEQRTIAETLAVEALYEAYSSAAVQIDSDWSDFERLADSLPRYGKGKNRGLDSYSWPAKLPVIPWLLFGKNAKALPRADDC